MTKNKLKKQIKWWKRMGKHKILNNLSKSEQKRLDRIYNRHRAKNKNPPEKL